MFQLSEIYKMIGCAIVLVAGLSLLTVRGSKIGWVVVAASLAYAWYEWLRFVY